MEQNYVATGYVLGNYWGGGTGAYVARVFANRNKQILLCELEENLKSGGLDSGMGYESLIGAIIYIEKTTFKFIDGEPFQNQKTETIFIGELEQYQKDFLAGLH